ncbi:ubiquitin carboxyl-terminal hydrolase [Aphelenchoides avenae]|nr:ubiquitin carboxyl-terminal hydrolase [Aphelenchus avenae]
MAEAGNWCLIESDPGVFTELIKGFGVNGVQVEEIYTLDDESFERLKPVYGLIFLFKWRAGDEPTGKLDPDAKDVFFAQQVISNACATQAIVNLLLNSKAEGVELGSTLEEFRNFCIGFDPANRGLCLSNSEEIRKVHNSFAREHYVELDERTKTAKEENYHFITYVPINGRVYELDGLREAPVDLGPIDEKAGWLASVRPLINRRIETYSAGEIHFNLMAVVGDQKQKYEKRLAEIAEAGMESDEVQQEIYELQSKIQIEEEKRLNYRKENVRRRHNYTPFIVELLKILAKEGKLVPLIEKGVEEAEKRKEKAKA